MPKGISREYQPQRSNLKIGSKNCTLFSQLSILLVGKTEQRVVLSLHFTQAS